VGGGVGVWERGARAGWDEESTAERKRECLYACVCVCTCINAYTDVYTNKFRSHSMGKGEREKECVCVCINAYADVYMNETRSHRMHTQRYAHTLNAYRVAKTHRIPYLYRSFSAKETYI